jgi:hypothetical protein
LYRAAVDTPPLFVAFADVLRLDAGAGAEVVYAPLTRSAHVLSPLRARAFLSCHGLATLDEHAGRAAQALGASPPALRAELAELAREGLLVPAADLLRRLAGAKGPPPPPIASLGIPTRWRPESLREALSTHLEDARAHGRAVACAVAEGARTEAEAAPARAVVAGIRARHGIAIAFAGPAERARFAAALAARAGVAEAIASFALLGDDRFPITTGASRNALLLHAAGELTLQVDDDTRCRLTGPPDPLPGASVTSIADPAELWPLPDDGAASPGPAPGRPFLALHEDLLGRAAGDAIASSPGGLDLAGASGMLFRRLEARGGRVLVTQTGLRGDSGSGSMAHLFALEGRSRSRFLADEAVYRRALATRRVIRVSPRPAIGDGTACLSAGLGLDARAVLPPFCPVQRNQDGLFGAVLRRAYHDALLGFLPWALDHEPPGRRATAPEAALSTLSALGANDLLRLLVVAARVEPDRDDPARSLRALGDVLVRWGSLPPLDLEDLVRAQLLRGRSLELSVLDQSLSRHRHAPAFWARDVARALEILTAAVASPAAAHPADLIAAFGEAEGRAAFRDLVRRYGELLRAWPDLWEAARALREEGVRPAV